MTFHFAGFRQMTLVKVADPFLQFFSNMKFNFMEFIISEIKP